MQHIKPVVFIVAILIALTFTLPTLLVLPFSNGKIAEDASEQDGSVPPKTIINNEPEVAVFRTKTNKIEKLPLEEYVIGVVASEMPVADFELEALKAQALAARTYIVSHLLSTGDGSLPEGANVDDTTNYQVYKDQPELKKIWGKNYKKNLQKVTKAVQETQGEILTYHEKPITASFFSTSNGFTENADEYWRDQIPYLKSVESPWDENESPKFESKKTFSISEFELRLGVKIAGMDDIGTITSRTSGNKVATVNFSGKEFTGREIREKLDLRSTDFSWVTKGDSITFTTKGFGHGVGMSQYGANGMAKEGRGYQDIVKHYYQDTAIAKVTQFFDQKLASNR